MPYSDYSYLDPLHIVWRKGTLDDPYIDRTEFLKVVNNKIVLAEIPDRFTRVKIAGMQEINYDGAPKKIIEPNEFSVNYSTGVIQVHPSQESNTLNVSYKGRGFIQYPASRIYHQDEMNGVVESLDKIIEEARESIKGIDEKVSDYYKIREDVLQTIVRSDVATAETKRATDKAIEATDMALDAYETTRLVFKPYVQTYDDIFRVYPSPEIGWTTQVYETGVRYRYDGISWVPIDLFGGGIPVASEDFDGLLSKEDFSRLQNKIDEDTFSNRVIVFVLPSYIYQGVQPVVARFPFNGEIVGARALCGSYGQTTTEISVAYLAAGGKRGLAQSIFQVGGNIGSSLGPVMTALIFVPLGQIGVLWFTFAALTAIVLQYYVARWYSRQDIVPRKKRAASAIQEAAGRLTRGQVVAAVSILVFLVFSKHVYISSITSFYSFYLIEDYGVSVERAQLFLFAFLVASAAGTFFGGPLADRYGRRNIIWLSIVGTAPFSLLLPHASLFWSGVLCVCAGFVLSSAFSIIVVYAQELLPGKVGLVSGLFFGLAFGIGGLGSAVLGTIADATSIAFIMNLCAFLPLLGLLALLLPRDEALNA